MSATQRSTLVELLRCAADIEVRVGGGTGLGDAARALELASRRIPGVPGDGHWTNLLDLMRPLQARDDRNVSGPGYEWLLLELAARIEEGSVSL